MRDVRLSEDGCELRAALVLPGEAPQELWVRGLTFPLTPDCHDALLLGALLPAMSRGANLRIEGRITHRLLASLHPWQLAWQAWRPGRYRAVEITADEVESDSRRADGVVMALSGGVDSLFTLVGDRSDPVPRARPPISHVMFVHGQDIPLSREGAFIGAASTVRAAADGLGAELLLASTNIRTLLPSIEDGHGLLLASVLNAASDLAGTAVLSASYSLQEDRFDWGSNPITDPHLSSGRQEVLHEGLHVTRIDKLEYLAATRPDVLRHLLVCPHLTSEGTNCCRCEKCARTWMSMRAVGIGNPGCYATEPSLDRVSPISEGLRPIWRLIADRATERGHVDVARTVRRLLRRAPWRHPSLRRTADRVPGARRIYQAARYAGKKRSGATEGRRS